MVGLARNCEATLETDVRRLQAALGGAKSVSWLIVESDSMDRTRDEGLRLRGEVPDFHFTSLGQLSKVLPRRTDRIAHCRNHYAQQLRSNPLFADVDYVVVADLDGLNDRITREGFESCWVRDDWDMCAANQDGPYYDIFASRHPRWCPSDCWAEYDFLAKYRADTEGILFASVHSRMIRIPESAEWLEVDAAFGGLAVYRKSLFDHCEYVGTAPDGSALCEHVHFHRRIRERGARLFINPRMINAGYNEHTIPLLLRSKLKRRAEALARRVLSAAREAGRAVRGTPRPGEVRTGAVSRQGQAPKGATPRLGEAVSGSGPR